LIKDNIHTADLPTTGGARALTDMRPATDAFVVTRLRVAGAIILAKTNLDEFARGATGASSEKNGKSRIQLLPGLPDLPVQNPAAMRDSTIQQCQKTS